MITKLSLDCELDARVYAAMSRICRQLGLFKDSQWFSNQAFDYVQALALSAGGSVQDATPTATLMIAGDELLSTAWETGMRDLRRIRGRQDYLSSLPSAAQLLEQLTCASIEIDQHSLSLDRENDVIWITNPYGIDSAYINPTVDALETFLANLRRGAVYGPCP